MPGSITLAELGVYLSINVAFLTAAWIVVKAQAAAVVTRLQEHTSSETEALDGLQQRVSGVEARLGQQPTHEDMYKIGIAVERLIARLDAQDRILARLDTITQRQEDYLISRSR